MFRSGYPQEFSGIAVPKNSNLQLFFFFKKRPFLEFSCILKEIGSKKIFCRQPLIKYFKTFLPFSIVSFTKTEAVYWKCFVKKVFLKLSQNSQENTRFRVSFLLKLQAQDCNFIQKETLTKVFSCEYYKILKNIFF